MIKINSFPFLSAYKKLQTIKFWITSFRNNKAYRFIPVHYLQAPMLQCSTQPTSAQTKNDRGNLIPHKLASVWIFHTDIELLKFMTNPTKMNTDQMSLRTSFSNLSMSHFDLYNYEVHAGDKHCQVNKEISIALIQHAWPNLCQHNTNISRQCTTLNLCIFKGLHGKEQYTVSTSFVKTRGINFAVT